ncbi:hypothetical protein Tco_1158784 [Tanacetum coccineum]
MDEEVQSSPPPNKITIHDRDNGEEDPISIALPRLLFLPNIIFTHVANKKALRATAAVSRTEASPAKEHWPPCYPPDKEAFSFSNMYFSAAMQAMSQVA